MKNEKNNVRKETPKKGPCSKEFQKALQEVKKEGKAPLIVIDMAKEKTSLPK